MSANTVCSDDNWAYLHGEPQISATVKHSAEDFVVLEELGFEPSDQGEHLFLRLQKRNLTTSQVADKLASTLGVSRLDVGYAGMKDRRALATQWFSVLLPAGRENKLSGLESEDLTILDSRRNARKLKTGVHKGNHFVLRLRNICGDRGQLEDRLERLLRSGVPNYFGQQRFGRELSSLHQVRQLMVAADHDVRDSGITARPGRQRRGLLYSAARSYLFNHILSARLREQSWNRYLEGDVLALDGTKRLFTVEPYRWNGCLQERLDALDIHPTGCLAGSQQAGQRYGTRGIAADMEKRVLAHFPELVDGLIRHGLRSGRRALRFRPQALRWSWPAGNELLLEMTLPAGAYATSLLREICQQMPGSGRTDRRWRAGPQSGS